jgi:iron(III) transport system ATP-binding protein
MRAIEHPTTATWPSLQVRGAAKRFDDVVAVDDVSLELGPHELLALVGPSGCGKSTLLRLVAGLVRADGGRIELGGRPVDDGRLHVPPERRGVGLVFQEHALFPHLSVGDNVAFGLRRAPDAARRTGDVLAMVGLVALRDRYPHELSGGERQRVALARALAPRPTLLLLDEPFASLDPNLRAQVRADVVGILRAEGTPAVFVTHDQGEAMAVGDRVAVMRRGRIEQVAAPYDVYHHPVNRFVASFMGEASYLDIDVGGDDATTEIGGSLGDVASGSLAMFRPDDVIFEPDPHGTAEVVDAEFRGSTWCYVLRLASGAEVRSTRNHLLRVRVGERVTATVTPGHAPVVISDLR